MSGIENNEARSIIPGHESQRITFGAFIRKRRKQLNLSQQAIAERIATGQATISAWENGKQFPIDEHFSALAIALELTEQQLNAAIPSEPRTLIKTDTEAYPELSVNDLEFLLGVAKLLPGQRLSWGLSIQLIQERQRLLSKEDADDDPKR